jgi:hypothetical protein
LQLESYFFSIYGVERPKEEIFFDSGGRKQNIEKKLPDAKKTFNDPSGGFPGPKKGV